MIMPCIVYESKQWMLHNFCDFAADYQTLLRTLKDPMQLRLSDKIIQFPFSLPVQEEKTEEEIARIAEKRKEQGKKLQEMAAKSRMEKVAASFFFGLADVTLYFQMQQKEKDLQYLLHLRESRGQDGKREWTVSAPAISQIHLSSLNPSTNCKRRDLMTKVGSTKQSRSLKVILERQENEILMARNSLQVSEATRP